MRVFKLILLAFYMMAGLNVATAQQAADSPPAAATAAVGTNYKLGIGDQVSVIVFGEPAFTTNFQVDPDGKIEFPLIGRVQATGRTVGEVSEELRSQLAQGYFRDPSVSMSVRSFRPFYILGEVNHPGQYPYRDNMSVAAAVATAEGYTYRAQKKYVFIRREGEAEEHRIEVTPDILVQPGDTLRVGERYF